jgi:hypothetical protein
MSNFYNKQTTSQIVSSVRRDLNGEGIDLNAESSAFLSWEEPAQNIILSGSSDVTTVSGLRGAILKLKD